MQVIKRYSLYLEKRPFFVTSMTTGVLCFLGDIITQTLIEKKSILPFYKKNISDNSFDFIRSFRAGFTGLTVMSVNLFFWYKKLLPAIIKKYNYLHFVKNNKNLSMVVLGKLFNLLFLVNF